jgi:Zn-dependent M28 family amino/carboxypeptidase
VKRLLLLATLALTLAACSRESVSAAPAAAAQSPAKAADLPHVDGQRAFKYSSDLTAFGPRWPGTPAHTKMEAYILEQLQGVSVEQDKFVAKTPVGPLPGNNIIAKFEGSKPGIIVIAGHYDTLYNRKDFVGANDGGASAGLLLELAQQYKGKKLDGYSIWLFWTDNEEAINDTPDSWARGDGLYGVKQLAAKWQKEGVIPKIKAFILLDMIGDADLNVDREDNSTPWLEDVVAKAASDVGYSRYFFGRRTGGVDDDHVPFGKLGVPVADLIDFNYGPNDAWHHSPQDTIDKVSAKSLEIVGTTVMRAVQLLNQQ